MEKRRESKRGSAKRTVPQKSHKTESISSRRFSALVGGLLILLALCCFSWIVVRQINGRNAISFTVPGLLAQPATTPTPIADPLLAAGITLSTPPAGQEPALSQQQALLLANQIEPEKAATGGVTILYTLMSSTKARNAQTDFHDVPVWLIHYNKIAGASPDTAADPQATQTSHDFYLFLTANSGQELLTIWL